MSNLSDRLFALTFEKINFANDEVESHIENLVSAGIELDQAADNFTAIAAGDADQEEIAGALVDLADLVDDVDLSDEQVEKLDSVVDRIVKTGSPEQKEATKELFQKVIAFQVVVKKENAWMDANFNGTDEKV